MDNLAEEMRHAVGRAGMNVMDVLDTELAEAIVIFWKECRVVRDELCKRGLAREEATQIVISYAVRSLLDA